MIISEQCSRKLPNKILMILKKNTEMEKWRNKTYLIIINNMGEIWYNLLSQFH